jgi:hypothetical protein
MGCPELFDFSATALAAFAVFAGLFLAITQSSDLKVAGLHVSRFLRHCRLHIWKAALAAAFASGGSEKCDLLAIDPSQRSILNSGVLSKIIQYEIAFKMSITTNTAVMANPKI